MPLFLDWLTTALIIPFSILAFSAPFWLWYKLTRPKTNAPVSHSLGEHLELFFSSSQMNWLVFCWAAAEAVVWFIIPEFLLFLIIFMRIRQRASLLLWDFSGTILGTAVAFIFPFSQATISQLPYITPGMVTQVNYWYQHFGVVALIFQPFSGVPYKVFTELAASHHIDFLLLLFVGVLVRMARYILIYVIFSGLYHLFHRLVFKKYIEVFVISCLIFSYFLLKIVHNYGPNFKIDQTQITILNFIITPPID